MSVLNHTACDCQRKSQSVSTELEINSHRNISKACCSEPVKHPYYELRKQRDFCSAGNARGSKATL